MNEHLAKQILKIFANNPFDAFNHKQISSRIGGGLPETLGRTP